MKLEYRKSESTVKPEAVDTTSSKTTVYLHKNIVEKERENFDSESYKYYEYDEAILTKEEYNEYLKELEVEDIKQQRADIDYIIFMTGLSEEV